MKKLNLASSSTLSNLVAGQVVRGVRAGTFVVLGFRTLGGEEMVQVQAVNSSDHTQRVPGSIALPLAAVAAL